MVSFYKKIKDNLINILEQIVCPNIKRKLEEKVTQININENNLKQNVNNISND